MDCLILYTTAFEEVLEHQASSDDKKKLITSWYYEHMRQKQVDGCHVQSNCCIQKFKPVNFFLYTEAYKRLLIWQGCTP